MQSKDTPQPELVFGRFFPEHTVKMCLDLWKAHGFKFIVSKKRKSKFGDYRYQHSNDSHTITVNGDLNQYAFLVTYLHEVAHLITHKKHGWKVSPHGREWKECFKETMNPFLALNIFPDTLQKAITSYMHNPGASSCSDPSLMITLQSFDKKQDGLVYLESISVGKSFNFRGRIFTKKELKRTRSLCEENATGRRYLIAEIARVKIIEQH